jgi:glycosyltransferase involved in cell wall biosynthesis
MVIPSIWHETYSLVLHEALACNMPVIASSAGGMAEKIQDGVNGFAFKIGDVNRLAQIMSNIVENPEIINSLKENIRKLYIPCIEQEAFQYERLYSEKVTEPGKKVRNPQFPSGRSAIKRNCENENASIKILLCTLQFFPDFVGGTEVLTLNTALFLKDRGYDVRVLTAYPQDGTVDDSERFDSYVYKDIPVVRFRHSLPMGDQQNIFEIEYNNHFFASNIIAYLDDWVPDLVHFFHFSRLSASAIDVFADLNIPLVYTATDFWTICPTCQLRQHDNSTCTGPDKFAVNCLRHLVLAYQPTEVRAKMEKLSQWQLFLVVSAIRAGLYPKKWFSYYIKALSMRPEFIKKRFNRIDKVLAPTRLMGEMLQNNGLSCSRLEFQHFGIDLEPFKVKSSGRGDFKELRVGFIGTLYEHKGVHLLIEAVKSLSKEIPVELKIYGDLELYPDYGNHLKDLAGGDARIEFCGTFPNDQIALIMSGIDVLAVPSIWYENTPLVIYSAQADGCPVIATNLGGMSEVIEHEVNGLLFNKEDVRELASLIRRLAEDRQLLKRLAANARQPKSMAEYVNELENHYQNLIKKH